MYVPQTQINKMKVLLLFNKIWFH